MTSTDIIEFENLLIAERGAINPRTTAQALVRLATRYNKIQVQWLNGPGGDTTDKTRMDNWQKTLATEEDALQQHIEWTVKQLGRGFGVLFDSDPRGCCVRVLVPSGRGNAWGDDLGICVPTGD